MAALASCRGDPPTTAPPVAAVRIDVDDAQIVVGATTHATATPLDAEGVPVPGLPTTWLSLTPGIIRVTASGDVTGLQAGNGQLRAVAGGAKAEAVVVVVNPLAAAIHLGRDTATLAVPGGTVQVIASVTDAMGRALTNPAITWSSSSPQVASVNIAGLVTAVASGTAVITAAIDGLTAAVTVTVRPAPVANAPVISAIVPEVLRPGGAYTVTGANFAPTPGGNLVHVDGLLASVQIASPTQLSIVLPTTGFVCEPARDAYLQVTAGGRIGGAPFPLQVAQRRALAPGQAAIVTSAAEVRCNELVPASGRWVVSVFNATRNPVSPTATGNVLFAVRGIAGFPVAGDAPTSTSTAPVPSATRDASTGHPPGGWSAWPPDPRWRSPADAHLSLLEQNIARLRDAPRRAAARPGGSSVGVAARASLLGTAGTLTTLKLPNLDAADPCVANTALGFRTVYAGPRVSVVEDTTAILNGRPTQKGQVDDYLTALGLEFESVMWPILTENFGNPLAMDAQLGGAGRVVMVFSPRVGLMQRGTLLGFATTCDLFPVAQRPSSNLGAFFYAVTPTSSATGFGTPDSRDQWLRVMRATVIHEVKHVIAFAERLSRGFPVEDGPWEEGSARIAEELYARRFNGGGRGTNTRYSASIGCEIRYATAGPCANTPVLMLRHFDALYSYMAAPELYSPLGRAFTSDFNFYAGAWSLLRWATDHFATSESAFLRDLIQAQATGVANIEARTGRAWEESLGEWSLAAYVDDIGGFVPASPRMSMPSWNYPDMWLGMCIDMGPCENPSNPVITYLRSTPFAPRQRAFGTFAVGIGSMAGGGFTLLDLSGAPAQSQVIEVKALTSDADAPPTVRIGFARVR